MKTNLILALVISSIFSVSTYAETIPVETVTTFSGVQVLLGEIPVTKIDKSALPSEFEAIATNVAFLAGLDLFGIAAIATKGDDDPWLNIRYELVNLTDQQQFFSLDMRMPTLATSGPTIKDSFMDIELFDLNNDGNVFVSDATSSFTVIDDDGGDLITAQDTIGQSLFFQFITGEGSHSVIDETGTGPNSDLFEGSNGFNFMRFLTNGSISAGDKLVITAMGCYANDAINCPERFIIPANAVPIPAAVWLFGSGLLGLIGLARRKEHI